MIKEYEQLNETVSNRLLNTLPALQINRAGSACRSMMEAFNAQLSDAYIQMKDEYNKSEVDTASADYLIRLGELQGVFKAPDENDAEYRERIIKSFTTNTKTTRNYILEQLYKNKEISEVIYKPFIAGNGSFACYIVPVGNSISDELLTQLQYTLNESVAAGCRGIIKRAVISSVQMKIRLILDSNNTVNEQYIKTKVISSLIDYLNSMRAGDPLIVNEIRTRTMNADMAVTDMAIEYIRINGNYIIIKNYYAREYEVIRPASNAAVVVV